MQKITNVKVKKKKEKKEKIPSLVIVQEHVTVNRHIFVFGLSVVVLSVCCLLGNCNACHVRWLHKETFRCSSCPRCGLGWKRREKCQRALHSYGFCGVCECCVRVSSVGLVVCSRADLHRRGLGFED